MAEFESCGIRLRERVASQFYEARLGHVFRGVDGAPDYCEFQVTSGTGHQWLIRVDCKDIPREDDKTRSTDPLYRDGRMNDAPVWVETHPPGLNVSDKDLRARVMIDIAVAQRLQGKVCVPNVLLVFTHNRVRYVVRNTCGVALREWLALRQGAPQDFKASSPSTRRGSKSRRSAIVLNAKTGEALSPRDKTEAMLFSLVAQAVSQLNELDRAHFYHEPLATRHLYVMPCEHAFVEVRFDQQLFQLPSHGARLVLCDLVIGSARFNRRRLEIQNGDSWLTASASAESSSYIHKFLTDLVALAVERGFERLASTMRAELAKKTNTPPAISLASAVLVACFYALTGNVSEAERMKNAALAESSKKTNPNETTLSSVERAMRERAEAFFLSRKRTLGQ